MIALSHEASIGRPLAQGSTCRPGQGRSAFLCVGWGCVSMYMSTFVSVHLLCTRSLKVHETAARGTVGAFRAVNLRSGMCVPRLTPHSPFMQEHQQPSRPTHSPLLLQHLFDQPACRQRPSCSFLKLRSSALGRPCQQLSMWHAGLSQ